MSIAELEAAWEDRPETWDKEWGEFDAGREAAVPLYKKAVAAFLTGDDSVSTFRMRMDSLGKKENWWGFRGNSQMFFNQLVKAAEPSDLEQSLKAALRPPANEAEARETITRFLQFVDETRIRADSIGATKPAPGRVPAFLSFFWELEEREEWPLFYPSSRDVLEEQGVLDLSESFEENYERYRGLIFALRGRLSTDTWGVEHLLWMLGPGRQTDDGSTDTSQDDGSEDPQQRPTSADVYAGYRARRLIFPDEVVTSFVLSLVTKEFVILSGISGTGKTKIALGLAEHLESTGGGEVIEIEVPADDQENFYVKLNSGVLERMRKTLRASAREALPTPERGSSVSFENVELEGGGTGSMRLNNIGFSDESKEALILFFRKDMADWIRANARLGDYLHFHVATARGAPRVRIVRQVVEETGEAVRRHLLVPVRSDWTDPRGLLGYFNPLTEQYVRTELLDLILRASADPDHPYLVILDEMNLARVEYYFSDFLSAIESKEAIPLLPSSVAEDAVDEDIPTALELPPNLRFVGTVNVDETTHAFSPKVLDRANVLEFSNVDLDQALGQGVPPPASSFRLKQGRVKPGWLISGSDPARTRAREAQEHAAFTEPLADVHTILQRFDRHFGYRVVDEISAFVGHALDKIGADSDETVRTAFDLQLCQKVLPKLTGGRELEEPLVHLLRYCVDRTTHPALDAGEVMGNARASLYPATPQTLPPHDQQGSTVSSEPRAASSDTSPATEQQQGAAEIPVPASPDQVPPAPASPVAYQRAAKKLLRMLDRLHNTGFVSALE